MRDLHDSEDKRNMEEMEKMIDKELKIWDRLLQTRGYELDYSIKIKKKDR